MEESIDLRALMIEFEALKVEAKAQEMMDRLAIAEFTSEMVSRRGKKYLDIANKMRDIASRVICLCGDE